MSDDTPTQRFPSSDSGDTPTQRLDTGEVQEDLQEEKQKSRGLLIGLVAAGGLLLLSIVVIAFFLLNRGQDEPIVANTDTPAASATPTPEASETPSATPEPEPSEAEEPPANNPPPAATGAAFSSFSPTKNVSCSPGGPYYTPDPPVIKISWATVRADSAWIVMGTSDAADSQYMQIPLNGNQSDFQYTLSYPCPDASATYTITLVGSDGKHVSKSWTVTNV